MASSMRPAPDQDESELSPADMLVVQLTLGAIGAPLIPLPITSTRQQKNPIRLMIRDMFCMEGSMAKQIVRRFVQAIGGNTMLNSIRSIYAKGNSTVKPPKFSIVDGRNTLNEVKRLGDAKTGSFAVWQKLPELWRAEMVVSGHRMAAGSDGKVAWHWNTWVPAQGRLHPFFRFFLGLDPRTTATLFSSAVYIGNERVKNEDCYVLKLEADAATLTARSPPKGEVLRHTVYGYFSRRTGLLVRLKDSHLVRTVWDNKTTMVETTREWLVKDYRTVEGVDIACRGRTSVSQAMYWEGMGPGVASRAQTTVAWTVEEVHFNVDRLSVNHFRPPENLTVRGR